MTKNADFDKYRYSGYGIGFDGSGFGKNVVISGADMNLSAHVDNRKKDMLILDKGSTPGLRDITLTAAKEYSISFTEQHTKFCLRLNYNGVNEKA